MLARSVDPVRHHGFSLAAGWNVNRVAEELNRRTSNAMILVGRARKIGPVGAILAATARSRPDATSTTASP